MKLYVSPTGSDRNSGSMDAPLLTLQEAVCRVKMLEGDYWDGSATIILREGRYRIEKPIEIAMHLPVTICAYDGEKAVIDGARVIEGLKEETVRGMRCFTADIPAVKAGKWFFRSLFANGKRCVRAYLPREGFYWIESVPDMETKFDGYFINGDTRFYTREGDMKLFKNLQDVEMHVFHYWVDEHMPVVSFDPATREVVSSHRSIFILRDDNYRRPAKYRIEHIFEGLCEPGDFYLDREDGKLYYLPYADETVENTVLSAPVAQQLLHVHDASDVRIEGITFEHTDWTIPGRLGRTFEHHDDGTLFASSPQAASNVPGALHFKNTQRCAVVNCEVSHVGGYGVCMEYACSSMQVCHNRLSDLGAGGVFLNGAHAGGIFNNSTLKLPSQPEADQSHHVQITDNEISFGGRVFLSGIGVASLHAHHVTIGHNYIHDLYYSGVSCGWIWGYFQSVSHDNIIEYNHIHTLGHGILSDMGGIYTLSVQPGTVIRNNLIHDIEKSNYGGWAIYPDEGSSHILIENNVCYDTSSNCFHQHYGRENIVRNNIFAFGREGVIAYTRKEPHIGFNFERNIVLTKGQPIYVGGGIDNIRADMNLYWDVDGQPLSAGKIHAPDEMMPLEALKAKGYDLFSKVADPKFADPQNGDFTLAADSPAFAMGFMPIDLSDVGPRAYVKE